MSKRSNVGTPNTLSNYFAKSPASAKKLAPSGSSLSASEIVKIEEDLTRKEKRMFKKEDSVEKDDSDHEEVQIIKRMRPPVMFPLLSPDEQENESDNTVQEKPKPIAKNSAFMKHFEAIIRLQRERASLNFLFSKYK